MCVFDLSSVLLSSLVIWQIKVDEVRSHFWSKKSMLILTAVARDSLDGLFVRNYFDACRRFTGRPPFSIKGRHFRRSHRSLFRPDKIECLFLVLMKSLPLSGSDFRCPKPRDNRSRHWPATVVLYVLLWPIGTDKPKTRQWNLIASFLRWQHISLIRKQIP